MGFKDHGVSGTGSRCAFSSCFPLHLATRRTYNERSTIVKNVFVVCFSHLSSRTGGEEERWDQLFGVCSDAAQSIKAAHNFQLFGTVTQSGRGGGAGGGGGGGAFWALWQSSKSMWHGLSCWGVDRGRRVEIGGWSV